MSLELERERTVQALCAHFAQDHLTTQELELRFEEVYRAASLDDLRGLTRGLPTLAPAAMSTTPLPMYAIATATSMPVEKRFLALMADVRRQGQWSVPARVKARAFMGAVRLDLREGQVPAEGVDIDVTAVMGEVRIILPPGLRADVDGLAVLGEFSDRTSGGGAPDAPLIRVHGEAIMGAVRVETRLPKEGALQAWKRRLLEN
ncbi:MAG: DUF1707 domain-containing protein [Gemmatimonadaceae bacterium]